MSNILNKDAAKNDAIEAASNDAIEAASNDASIALRFISQNLELHIRFLAYAKRSNPLQENIRFRSPPSL